MTILNEPNKNKRSNYLRQTGLLAAVPGLLIAGPLVGYFLGQWGDRYFHTDPWLLITGIVLGFTSAGREIWRLVKKAEAYNREDAKAANEPPSSRIQPNSTPRVAPPASAEENQKDFPGNDPGR